MASETSIVPAGSGFRDSPRPEEPPPRIGALRAALLAYPVLVVTLLLIGEIAAEPTWAPGVLSSAWTPLRGLAAVIFGAGAYGRGFAPLPIVAGLVMLAVYAVVLGTPGVLALRATIGPRPHPGIAMATGTAYGLFIQIVVVNVIVNNARAEPMAYHALPPWGWWVANGAFGAALGFAISR